MGTAIGRTDSPVAPPEQPPVKPLWLKDACSFDFFQAVRLLLRHVSDGCRGDGRPEEQIHFRVHQTLAFPASDVQSVAVRADNTFDVNINFLGLTGPIGVLPVFYTEHLIDCEMGGDGAPAAFLDLFNNRFAWMFYRVWEKHRIQPAYERDRSAQPEDARFTFYLLSLLGMGTAGLKTELKIPDSTLVFYSGILAQRPRNSSNLRSMLSDYFQVKIEIRQWEGMWVDLDHDSLSWLGEPGLHNQLGYGAIAGDQVWNAQARFRIVLGPVDFPRYLSFLPGEPDFTKLKDLTNFYVDWAQQFEVQIMLRADEVPRCSLGDSRTDARLGYSSWLKTDEMESDADDLIVRVQQ